jgi:hypothetical protein
VSKPFSKRMLQNAPAFAGGLRPEPASQASYFLNLIALYSFIVSVTAFSTGSRSILEAP